jgi:hypothetical protein
MLLRAQHKMAKIFPEPKHEMQENGKDIRFTSD